MQCKISISLRIVGSFMQTVTYIFKKTLRKEMMVKKMDREIKMALKPLILSKQQNLPI